MTLKTRLVTLLMLLAATSIVKPAHADFIGGSQLTPSTSLIAVNPFVVSQIADNITSDGPSFNGFVSDSTSGTITFGLDQTYTLNGFTIWNDINVQLEGIAQFRLDFFDESLSSIGSTAIFTAPQGQVAPETYNFADVAGVRSVNLVILSSHAGNLTRIEIREVGFEGFAVSAAAPEPGSIQFLLGGTVGLLGLFAVRRKRASRTAP